MLRPKEQASRALRVTIYGHVLSSRVLGAEESLASETFQVFAQRAWKV
jgi:hypothetical protein